MAGPVQANAQVGVLGDVEGVPSTELDERLPAKVVRRPAERHRRVASDKSRQQLAEPHRVLPGEPPGQQVLVAVVVAELCLEADDAGHVMPESGHNAPELQRLRPILDVVDRDEFTARLREADVAGLGLGPGRPVRYANHVDVGLRSSADGRRRGLGIVFFE